MTLFHLIQVCVTSAVETELLSNLKIVGRNSDFCELWVFVFNLSDWLIMYFTVKFLLFCSIFSVSISKILNIQICFINPLKHGGYYMYLQL
jgi:hypothetical protein